MVRAMPAGGRPRLEILLEAIVPTNESLFMILELSKFLFPFSVNGIQMLQTSVPATG